MRCRERGVVRKREGERENEIMKGRRRVMNKRER